jgi:PAS domain S-box-containing protein
MENNRDVTEHGDTEETLRLTASYTRSLIEASPDPLVTIDLQGRISDVNAATELVTGCSRTELIGTDFSGYFTEPERARAGYFRAFSQGLVRDYSLEIRHKDGRITPVLYNASVYKDAGGRVIGVLAAARDDAERRRAQEELLWKTAFLEALVDASSDAILVIEGTGKRLLQNRRTTELWKIPQHILDQKEGDAQVRHIMSLVKDPDRFMAKFVRLCAQKDACIRDEVELLDGRVLDGSSSTVVGKDGQYYGKIWTFRDITERKNLEAQLKESEERYRNLFENAIEGIYQSTPGFRVMAVNPALARMHGYATPEEMIEDVASGKKLFVRDGDVELGRSFREGQGVVRGFEAELVRADGSSFWASIDSWAIRDDHGKILYYEGIVDDITERKRLEDQLRQAQRLEAVGTLASGVAHDFNNRLTVITGFGHLIHEGIDKESPLRPYIDEILSSAEKAANLTRSLLAFSREQYINLEPHNINDIVGSTGSLLSRLLPEDIEVRLLLTDEKAIAMADATQMDQVLMNLATNARDAMPKGGILTIETSVVRLGGNASRTEGDLRPGTYVMLSVADTGIGMDEATRRRVFDPFFTTKEVGKGTGLGLSSVYGIVKQHEGHITVSSEPGQGTTFRIYLPLAGTGQQHDTVPEEEAKRDTETTVVAEDQIA